MTRTFADNIAARRQAHGLVLTPNHPGRAAQSADTTPAEGETPEPTIPQFAESPAPEIVPPTAG